MTRKEAIEILKSNKPKSDPRECGKELCTAVDMAIEALQEPESDVVTIVLLHRLQETVHYDGLNCDGYCIDDGGTTIEEEQDG